MAEHTIETRILLRYDTLSNWMNSNTILKQGEAAIAIAPYSNTIENLSNSSPGNTPPAVGIKIGDGFHYFHELPWVQGIAADVYNWAKQITKPTYVASEIQGLDTYIEEHSQIIGDGTIAPRLYQIIQGLGDNANKYYLQYKESTENDWTIDVNHYIDLEDLARIKEWIGESDLNEYPNLATRTGYQALYLINELNYSDTEINKQFVVAVDQSKGKITPIKRQPKFSDLAGVATIEQGGTGVSSLPSDQVLIGNGVNAILGRPIAEEIANNNYLVPSYLVKSYVDKAVAGLTGAMHFIGEATVVITPNSSIDPRIPGYDLSHAQLGDVILYNAQEYVWTGGNWHLLGDEGSYAVKGSITNSDISEDAAISQSKIANLTDSLLNKVDKIEGKSLSSNDFTNELKKKLEDIGTNAETNVIEHIFLNDTEIRPTVIDSLPKSIDLKINEFSEEAQEKLNSIAYSAQVNKIEKIIYNNEEIIPDENKVITINPDPHLEHINKIEHIIINEKEYRPNENKEVKITLDDAALNLEVIKGARVLGSNGIYEDIAISMNKKLELARIAKTGNIEDIIQSANTHIILDCGTSTTVL